MRGQFKKQEAKVEDVDIKKSIVYLSKVEHTKRDGTKARYPINASNVLLIELSSDDKKRLTKPESKETKEVKDKKSAAKPKTESKESK